MLYMPSSNFKSQRGDKNLVTSSNQKRGVMRANTQAVNPRTYSQTRWRHIFGTIKQAWRSLGVGGANYILTDGLSPQQAWGIQAAQYSGILNPGLLSGLVRQEQFLTGCETVEAYYTMCQANVASLGLPPLGTPVITSQLTAPVIGVYTDTSSPYTLTVTGEAQVQQYPATAFFSVGISTAVTPYATPTAPTTNANLTAYFNEDQIALTENNSAVTAVFVRNTVIPETTFYPATLTVSGLPPLVTADLNRSGLTTTVYPSNTNPLPVTLAAAPGVTPGSYTLTLTCVSNNVTNYGYLTLVIYAEADNNYTISASSLPSGATAVLYNPTLVPTYSAKSAALQAETTLILSNSSITASGTYSFDVDLAAPAGSVSVSPQFTVTTGTSAAANPPPTYNFPSTASCTTVLDADLNVVEFALSYTWLTGNLSIPDDGPASAPGVWAVSASPAYKSSYSAPAANTWQPIGFFTGYNPTSPSVLEAWEAVFGALPLAGKIKFQIFYLDPVTGAGGPALRCTATWEFGTLKGSNYNLYAGPEFGFQSFTIYDPTITYNPGDVVDNNGDFWTCIQTATGITPGAGAYWVPGGQNIWTSAWPWSKGQIVWYGGSLWLALQASTGITPSNSSYWQPSPVGNWDSGTNYYTNGLAFYSGFDWTALQDSIGIPPAAGAYWSDTVPPPTPGVHAPGSYQFAVGLIAGPGYSGTVTLSISNPNSIQDILPTGNTLLPALLTATITPPQLTFTLGDTSLHTAVFVLSAPGGAQGFSGLLEISATDGVMTKSINPWIVVDGDVVYYLGSPGLSIDPGQSGPAFATPGSITIDYTVRNTATNAINAQMVASIPGTAITGTFSPQLLYLPGGSFSSPTSATTTLTLTCPIGIDTLGINIQVAALSGIQSAYAAIILD